MLENITFPGVRKIRHVALAIAAAGPLLLGTAGQASAAEFFFYGDHMTDYLLAAGPYSPFDPLNPTLGTTSEVGTTEVYTDATGGTGLTITAAAFNPFGMEANLVENTRGANDLGLGSCSASPCTTGNNPGDSSQPLELAMNEVIRIDLGVVADRSNVIAYFSSIDGTEEMQVWNSSDPTDDDFNAVIPTLADRTFNSAFNSTAGTGGVAVNLSFLFTGSAANDIDRYVFFRESLTGSDNEDVLLMQIAFDVASMSVPEPGSLGLFGLGIIGLGFARRRHKVRGQAMA